MGFIFWMSTGTFSSENTSSVLELVLRFLVPEISAPEVDLVHGLFRKAGHLFEYFLLGFLLFRAFRADSIAAWNWRWAFWATLLLVFWAASDEFHQSFVPTRTASIIDVGIDSAGGILAQFASTLWYRQRKKRS